jgi:hypothetical protein
MTTGVLRILIVMSIPVTGAVVGEVEGESMGASDTWVVEGSTLGTIVVEVGEVVMGAVADTVVVLVFTVGPFCHWRLGGCQQRRFRPYSGYWRRGRSDRRRRKRSRSYRCIRVPERGRGCRLSCHRGRVS